MDSGSIDSMIMKDAVVVFSKSWCPFCVKAKNLLKSKGVPFKAYELDGMPDGSAIQGALSSKTKQSTVPNIFIGGKHVGGCDDLHAASKSGKLTTYLASAGISVK